MEESLPATPAENLVTTSASLPLWWENRVTPEAPAGYLAMIDTLRELQDRVAAAVPRAELVAEATEQLAELNRRLGKVAVDEWERLSGRLDGEPGRGQVLVPVVEVEELTDQSLTGRVRFGPHYLGGNGAVHGGALPLLFDDVLGRLAQTGGRPISRTAYLHVDFRNVTPVDTDLAVEAWFVHQEGRKHVLRGAVRAGDRLCAEVEGLFVELRPGQP